MGALSTDKHCRANSLIHHSLKHTCNHLYTTHLHPSKDIHRSQYNYLVTSNTTYKNLQLSTKLSNTYKHRQPSGTTTTIYTPPKIINSHLQPSKQTSTAIYKDLQLYEYSHLRKLTSTTIQKHLQILTNFYTYRNIYSHFHT